MRHHTLSLLLLLAVPLAGQSPGRVVTIEADAPLNELSYTPSLDLTSGEVHGAEALVRWQHPERGLVPPAEFIELAEVSGLIQPMTRWIIALK